MQYMDIIYPGLHITKQHNAWFYNPGLSELGNLKAVGFKSKKRLLCHGLKILCLTLL